MRVDTNLTSEIPQRPDCTVAADANKPRPEAATDRATTTVGLSPNPVQNGKLLIQAEKQIEQVTISDLLGRMHRTYALDRVQQMHLMVSDFPSGTYTVTFRFTDGSSRTEKLLIVN